MPDDSAIIIAEGLSKAYGGLPALRSLNFRVRRGEFVALLGANGSGKSTLLRLLSGLSKPTAGAIRIGGWEMPREAMAVRAQIGLVAHQPLLYENLTARENLEFFGKLYGIGIDERERRIAEALRTAGLSKGAGSLVRAFSRGMKQRLSIARATLHQPDVLLLDEPYSGLDQAAIERLDELLSAATEDGRTIIMSTHQLERIPRPARRALVLARGRIAFDDAIGRRNMSEIYRSSNA
ncbi:MAG: heme ABC exporter ATP-binding protein CcmA [Chloroflexota bacterium]|nr:heme ABC exporter ATP-binding protein CcmA [Chloroflexota bacterium]MDE2909779.1 heme ABC exporter ATP-binding protein CcmA [Chloroflexota bacterium]